MQHFGQIMFTDRVQAEQTANGSRDTYARMTDRPAPEGLGEDERLFIETRTSFYMATVTETGWPYVQHRGGPAGFLKVHDPQTIGFADYRGNRQYVSTGNLRGDGRVSLFLMDYPRKARLKLLGHARVTQAADDPETATKLTTDGQGRVERLFLIDIAAFDWNCPQFITPRYSEDELQTLLGPRMQKMAQDTEIFAARLRALGEDPDRLLAAAMKEDST